MVQSGAFKRAVLSKQRENQDGREGMRGERDDEEGARDGHLRLLRLIDYRRRWIRIVWPDGRRLERLRRSTTLGVVVLARYGAAVVALQGEEAERAWARRCS